MKKTLIGLLTGLSFSFTIIPGPITGRWKVYDPRGPQFQINFRTDNSFTAYTNDGKVLITGNYRTDKDTFLVNDLNCNAAYWGKYQLGMITEDSIAFKLISDTCSGRSEAVNGIVMARLKQQ